MYFFILISISNRNSGKQTVPITKTRNGTWNGTRNGTEYGMEHVMERNMKLNMEWNGMEHEMEHLKITLNLLKPGTEADVFPRVLIWVCTVCLDPKKRNARLICVNYLATAANSPALQNDIFIEVFLCSKHLNVHINSTFTLK